MKTPSQSVYVSPFSRGYWKSAVAELHSVRSLVLAALFIAMRMAIKSLKIPVAENLDVYFTFLPNAVGSFLYGPVVGFVSGCVCDTLSFIIAPSGAYNPAFMFIEGLGSLLLALPLYRAKVSVVRLFLAKFSVNVVCNILLTPLFLSMMYGSNLLVIFPPRLIKNALSLPVEVILLVALFAALLPIMRKMKVVPWLDQTRLRLGLFGR